MIEPPSMLERPQSLTLRLPHRGATRRLGRALGTVVRAGDLLLLRGDLGAGKTFLTRALARGLGVPASVRVTSPTFELVHELPGRVPLIHVDLYRLDDPGELVELGLRERIGADAVVVVEWGERMVDELGRDHLGIELGLDPSDPGGSVRVCSLHSHGPVSADLLSRLLARYFPGPQGLTPKPRADRDS
ncbi:MAG: tRNA (adenosine(37)-N6)-threonylcarbamoyltransferase complex ATPase subunit type 1 TsaE [Myxococcales bacterium]|nr:tRNA (adenosine(37)-N6)-threonylcarbamoyltransferase complex ATPase subunit type 1 TsaE [Myxococcales bacterium]